jgi:GTPase SAR1 family protein
MAYQTPNLPVGQSDEGFDLSQIFIGRQQQLDIFEIYLHRWKQLILTATSDQSPITTPPSPSNKIQGLVVLLFGRGGFGKSTLLNHYRTIALQEGGNPLTSTIVDWEFAIEGKRSLFNPPQGQPLNAAEYFKVLCGELAIALEKDRREFKAYQAAMNDVERAKKEASNFLDSMQKDDRYSWLRGLTVEIITSAVTTYVPGSKAVVESKAVQETAHEVAKLTQVQITQIYDRLRNKLGNKLDDYLEPSLRLGLALGSDLRDMARNYPLLIFFDTYEEADEGDRLLRMVMGAAGIRVGWVIAGRDNL